MTEAKKIRELFKLGVGGVNAAIGIMIGRNYPVSKIVNITLAETGIMSTIKYNPTRWPESQFTVSLHKEYHVNTRRGYYSLNPDERKSHYESLIYHYIKTAFLKKCRAQLTKDLIKFIKETYDYE